MTSASSRLRALPDPCGCYERCGDDGDIDGPGTCKGLPRMPDPPLVEIVLVPRSRADQLAPRTEAKP